MVAMPVQMEDVHDKDFEPDANPNTFANGVLDVDDLIGQNTKPSIGKTPQNSILEAMNLESYGKDGHSVTHETRESDSPTTVPAHTGSLPTVDETTERLPQQQGGSLEATNKYKAEILSTDKPKFTFKDCIGRKFTLPVNLVMTWAVSNNLSIFNSL
jgi:hypothetical protein